MSTTTLHAPLGTPGVSTAPPSPNADEHPLPALSIRYRLLVWSPLVAAVVMAAALWPFVSHALLSNVWLNGKILVVMLWGVWTMLAHVQRVYREDAVFRSGMAWLRQGALSGQPDPKFGQRAYVTGMLERLSKLGLGHQVYVHSATAEPELDALGQYLDRKQELSQFLVGLMVGLGLLGTFVGLLQTLVQTSELIGTIANSTGGGGANMEQEFAKIVGGLQGPLAGMGTAFSASMFGLVGSILLGFQLVVVRKTAADFVERVRREVLSLAEASKVNETAEVTERFLATLMADMIEQQRASAAGLAKVMQQLETLVPKVEVASTVAAEVAIRVRAHEETLERTAATVGAVGRVVPVLDSLAESSRGILRHGADMNQHVERMVQHLPAQDELMQQVTQALAKVERLATEVGSLRGTTQALKDELRGHGTLVKRMDATLWNLEKDSLRSALEDPRAPGSPDTNTGR
jgi:hypothetical protein